MARSPQHTHTAVAALSWPLPRREDLTAQTGSHCPRTGLWSPAQDNDSKIPLSKGTMMPARDGAPVLWTYQGRIGAQTPPSQNQQEQS
jgi:hypothetical protein